MEVWTYATPFSLSHLRSPLSNTTKVVRYFYISIEISEKRIRINQNLVKLRLN